MYNILVVDDEIQILKILEKFLKISGFEAVSAISAEEALKIIKSNAKIDLMVVDLKMPLMSGAEFLRELEMMNKKIPCIILSGYPVEQVDNFDELKKMGYGEDDFLLKPVDLNELLDAVKNKLPRETN